MTHPRDQFRRIDMDSAVLGARFSDGGHHVNGEDSAPIRLDEPLTTPEDSGLLVVGAQVFLVAVTVILTTLAVLAWLKP